MEHEPESRIVSKNFKVQPSDIYTGSDLLNTFGQFESEEVAKWIVELCQEKGMWDKFSEEELLASYNRKNKGRPLQRIHFYILVDPQPLSEFETGEKPIMLGGGWIIEKDGNYFITQEFVERCYERHPKRRQENNLNL